MGNLMLLLKMQFIWATIPLFHLWRAPLRQYKARWRQWGGGGRGEGGGKEGGSIQPEVWTSC